MFTTILLGKWIKYTDVQRRVYWPLLEFGEDLSSDDVTEEVGLVFTALGDIISVFGILIDKSTKTSSLSIFLQSSIATLISLFVWLEFKTDIVSFGLFLSCFLTSVSEVLGILAFLPLFGDSSQERLFVRSSFLSWSLEHLTFDKAGSSTREPCLLRSKERLDSTDFESRLKAFNAWSDVNLPDVDEDDEEGGLYNPDRPAPW